MLAMLLALTTLIAGYGTLSQNPTSGGYQLFEPAASGVSADIQLASLGNFAPSPETASECCNAPNRTVSVESGKFDYLFGRVTSGTHNTARSQQMKTELARVGVHDTSAGRKIITDHLDDVVKDPANITGTFTKTIDGQVLNFETRQSLFSGPGGFLQFNSTFRVNADGTRSLSTIIPKGGN